MDLILLAQCKSLQDEIRLINEHLVRMGTDTVGSQPMDGMPHGTNISNPTANLGNRRVALMAQEAEYRDRLMEIQANIQREIIQIENPDVRKLLYAEYVDGLSKSQAAKAANMHRNTARLILQKFFKEQKR